MNTKNREKGGYTGSNDYVGTMQSKKMVKQRFL